MISDPQSELLEGFGATASELAELRNYSAAVKPFDPGGLDEPFALPLADEPFVAVWEEWAAEASRRGAFAVLRERLPQLCFPIREGISLSAAYREATLSGRPAADLPE
ncbi:MAG: hypothetical protein M3O15_03910, partial [Acidobacteriota bacterium]|nr:hypothetical protein [Acidobacteriota bacterium]